MAIQDSPLGKETVYLENYSSDLLFPVPRKLARDKLGISTKIPFQGIDIWNAYELSWLNPKGKPEIALAEISFPCTTPNIIESKSLKLYFNSFNQSVFESKEVVKETIRRDLSQFTGGEVTVTLFAPSTSLLPFPEDQAICIDDLDIEVSAYHLDSKFLVASQERVEECLYSNLLKSNCLATGQPDWGSVYIVYSGPKIHREGLLKYIISHRAHSAFAEYCVEQIFCDILKACQPECLSVFTRFTRRGGIDINPYRSNYQKDFKNYRSFRQ